MISKKLMCLAAVIFLSSAAHAEDKQPNKDETIKFIDKVVKQAIGKTRMKGRLTTTAASFDGAKYTNETKFSTGRQTSNSCSDFKWETVADFRPSAIDSEDGDALSLKVVFTEPVRVNGSEGERFENTCFFIIPRDRQSSFEKAIMNLARIAKEEDVDPFAE